MILYIALVMWIRARLFLVPLLAAFLCSFAEENEEVRLFFDGEMLYWKPNQTAMTYCLVTDSVTGAILGSQTQSKQQHMTWNAGFRVGTGVRIPTVHCDISVFWTRFHHTMNGSTNTDEFILGTQLFLGSFIPIGGGGVAQISPGNTPAGPASSQWKLHLDLIECDFGYEVCFDKRFSLHPYLGIEGGWINQKQTIEYDQFYDSANQLFFDSTIALTNNFKGIGPKVGIEGDLVFGYGFGLLGNISAILLYGSSHNPVAFHIEGDSLAFPFTDFSLQYEQHRLLPAVQAQIGLNWGRECFEYFTFYLNVAYEVQYFWNTWRNQSSTIQSLAVSDAGYGNLMLHGLTGQVQFAF